MKSFSLFHSPGVLLLKPIHGSNVEAHGFVELPLGLPDPESPVNSDLSPFGVGSLG